MIINKCNGCSIREVGCHANCKYYKEYIGYLSRIKEIKRLFNLCRDSKCDRTTRYYSNHPVYKRFK